MASVKGTSPETQTRIFEPFSEPVAITMLYRETVTQAQLLAYADDFWLLAMMFAAVSLLSPLMRRIRMEPSMPATAPATERAAAHVAE